jgi:AcrR family transcriptional regulator
MSQRSVNGNRRYDNTGRAEQAAANRHRVLEATHRLLISNGYAATTIKAVAAEAGVSAETIYKSFGTKAKLIKDTYDATLVGDEEPIPLIERPEYQALIADTSARGKLIRYATISRVLSSRLGPLLDVLLSGAKSGDPDLREFAETIKRERLFGATEIVRQVRRTGGARADLDPDRARDLIWTLNSPEVYQLLSRDRGWTDDQYEDWLARSYIDELLG